MIYYRPFCIRCGYYLPHHAYGCRYELLITGSAKGKS